MKNPISIIACLCIVLFLHFNAQADNGLIIGETYLEPNAGPAEIEAAKQRAMVDLMNQIQVNVKSEFVNEVTETANSLSEYTASKINVMTDMQVEGARFNVIDKDNSKVVQAILNKAEAAGLYREKTLQLNDQLAGQVRQALNFIQTSQNEKALQSIFNASKTFNKIEQQILLYMILGGADRAQIKPQVSRSKIDSILYDITETKMANFDDAVANLCFQISRQIPPNQQIAVFPLNYEKTSFFSELSEYTRQKIESSLTRFLQFKMVSAEKSAGVKNVYHISGNYWPRKDVMEIIVLINDGAGQTIGSARVTFPLKYVSALNISIKPQNFVDAYSEDKYFAKNEVIYGDLKIDFWTNKGGKNLIFKEGEEMRLYIRANTPCYVRFIYHLANGIRTPLFKNYYINELKVNKVVELPESFVCAPPFGVEKLQLIASTEGLPALKTEMTTIEGEEYEALSEDLKQFLARTRGFIKNKTKGAKTAERVITITTMDK